MNTNYPWFKNYPAGVPFEINPNQYESILELLEECFEKYADLPAFVNMGKSLTYKEVDVLSKRFAVYLQKHSDLKPGDRIAIQLPNLLQYPIVLYGALRAGLIVVNTNPLYTPREMEYQFKDSDVKAIVILANFATNLEKIISHTNIHTVIVTEIGDLLGGLKGKLTNFVVKYVKKMIPSYHLPQALSLQKILHAHSEKEYKKPTITGNHIAFLQYTGGTTGVSKGAMLSHRNIIANVEQSGAWWQ
jgi:long-chain acyl-CoA synthetase